MPTRSFGDLHLKHEKFNNPENYNAQYGFRKSKIQNFTGPYITHAPDVVLREIRKNDKYIILASDGLWDELTEHDSAAVVKATEDPSEISWNLLEKALSVAAKNAGMGLPQILQIPQGSRRNYHDDITIVVLPLNS
jgi:pyruvate dehydrogenase phosphatase